MTCRCAAALPCRDCCFPTCETSKLELAGLLARRPRTLTNPLNPICASLSLSLPSPSRRARGLPSPAPASRMPAAWGGGGGRARRVVVVLCPHVREALSQGVERRCALPVACLPLGPLRAPVAALLWLQPAAQVPPQCASSGVGAWIRGGTCPDLSLCPRPPGCDGAVARAPLCARAPWRRKRRGATGRVLAAAVLMLNTLALLRPLLSEPACCCCAVPCELCKSELSQRIELSKEVAAKAHELFCSRSRADEPASH